MTGSVNVMPFEITTTPIVLYKEVDYQDSTNEDYENHPHDSQATKYRTGFRVGGGIDQDLQKCPYGYSDNGAYVTYVYPASPAEESGLRVNDKLIQVNGHDLQFATHQKVVEIIQRYPVLNMLVHRTTRTSTSGAARSPLSSTSGQNGVAAPPPPRHPAVPNHYAPNPYPQYR